MAPTQRRVRVHHLEIEESASIERRGNMGGQLKGDGTVQLGVGNHAPSKGGVGKVTEPVLPPVAPNGELSRRDVGMAASRRSVSISSAATAPSMIEKTMSTTPKKA